MTEPITSDPIVDLRPVLADGERPRLAAWSQRLVVFLRLMAAATMIKGLYHWSVVCGFAGGREGFVGHPLPWQTATVFFAVIDLVAAVGLWLAAPWGAVVWLTASVSMVVVDVFFPQVYGSQTPIVLAESLLIGIYLFIAIQAAREQPQ